MTFGKIFLVPLLTLALAGCFQTGGAGGGAGFDVGSVIAGVRQGCQVLVSAQDVLKLFNTGLTDKIAIITSLCSAFDEAKARSVVRGQGGGGLAVIINGQLVRGRAVIS